MPAAVLHQEMAIAAADLDVQVAASRTPLE
jgi:hypothetical protein